MMRELLLLRKAWDSSGDVLFVTDADELFLRVNPEFTRLYGYSPDEVVGQATPAILAVGPVTAEQPEVLRRRLQSERLVTRQFVCRTKAGEPVTIEGSYVAVYDEEEHLAGYLGRQRVVHARQKAGNDSICRQETRTIAQLAGEIAHEFNNLMTTVIGYADILLQEPSLAEAMLHDLTAIREAGEKASLLSTQLSGLQRSDIPRPRVIRLNSAAGRA